jgi:flavin reductase (DIM6/NTAB) family NADH-FMN oxidoreductase RutF
MAKHILEPNTTLYPVPVVLITAGIEQPNLMTCNRIASCSAEPPRLCISIRPLRHSHKLIAESGEFVVNIPAPHQQLLSDYVGVVNGRKEDKWAVTGLTPVAATRVRTPLIAECPVNIECTVEQQLDLGSHTLFIGLVQTVHVEEALLDAQGELNYARAQGIAYDTGIVRERPTYKFRVEELRATVQASREKYGNR